MPEVTVGIDNHSHASGHGHSTDAGNISVCVCSLWVADADGVGLARNPKVADIDIVITRREICTGATTQCDVAAAGCVVRERLPTVGRVGIARCVAV